MPRFSVARPSAFPRARALLAVGAAVAIGAPAARAQPVTLTFDALTAVDASGVRYVDNCYEEGGFRVALDGVPCGAPAALATWTPDNDLYYTGTPALYNNFPGAVDFTRVGGGTFALRSIGLASFLGQLGNPTSVLFTGVLVGGGTVTRSVDVPEGVFGTPAALSVYDFTGFDALSALRLTVVSPDVEPFVQFDAVSLAAVPEPATAVLLGGGLVALVAVARRRAR
jgi:hypothetical protein